MNAVRTALARRDIAFSVERVDDLLYDVLVDDAMSEHARLAIIDARLSERPFHFGAPSPSDIELRKEARLIEEKVRAMRNVVAVTAVVLKSHARTAAHGVDLNSAPTKWAHVGVIYLPIDERGTAATRVDDVQKAVAELVGVKPADVVVDMKRHGPVPP